MQQGLVILIAYHFPPGEAIGGARPFRFYKFLREMGYQCHVITAVPQTEPCDTITYVSDEFETGPKAGLRYNAERAFRKLAMPGAVGIRWALRAYREARKIIEASRTDRVTVLSSFPPLGAHIVGWLLAGDGYDWIADFRDPLAGTSADPELYGHQRKIRRMVEKSFCSRARKIIANTDTAALMFAARYPHRVADIQAIWNGFDPDARLYPLDRPKRAKKQIVHVGGLYVGRTALPVLQSVRRLIDNGRISADEVCLALVGPMDEDAIPSTAFLEQAKSEGWLDFRPGAISRPEALRIAQQADGLLLLQPQSNTQVPGKLFEYIEIGRPVLAYILADSPIERILRESGVPYRCMYADAPDDVLDRALEDFMTLSPVSVSPSEWFLENFDGRRQTRELARTIDSLQPGAGSNTELHTQAPLTRPKYT